MMYDELVNDLRYCSSGDEPCESCKRIDTIACEPILMSEAADAIEELQQQIVEFQLALDGANDKIQYALGKDYCYDLEYGREMWNIYVNGLKSTVCPHYKRNVHDRGDDSLCEKYRCEVNDLPKWISVKERLPEEGEIVLACVKCAPDNHLEVRQASRWCDEAGGWGIYEGCVTHWMPLPTPPKEETE